MEMTAALDKLKEQEWYQQIQSSYQQLTPEQQNGVKWGSVIAGFLAVFYLAFSMILSANSIKKEFYEKQELARVISDATEELRRLKGQSMGMTQSTEQNWKVILTGMLGSQGIPPDSLEIMKETPGAAQNAIHETLLEIKIKGISLRPLIQVLGQLEHSSPPIKLKGMTIESGGTEGVLNAKLNLSGYLARPEKGEKSK